MAKNTKVSADEWIEAAKKTFLAEGLAGVKIDRLAKALGVTRGGFYYNFKSQKDLHSHLLKLWKEQNQLVPNDLTANSPATALAALEKLVAHVVTENDFSPDFEMAIRDWARTDREVEVVVEKVDAARLKHLTKLYAALGCDDEEAPIRAKVWYFHQLGYYGLKYHKRETTEQRLNDASTYLRILCGRRYIEAAEKELQRWS